MPAYTTPSATDPTWPVLERIRDLFATRLNDAVPTADQVPVAIITGTQAVIDDCCPGYAWVRLVRAYPSNTFPTPATSRVGCPDPLFALEVELGVARCAAAPNQDGSVDIDELEDEAEVAGRDRSVMFQVVMADVPSDDTIMDGDCQLTLGQWNPVAHQGGCFGGSITFTVPYEQCVDTLTGA